VSLVAEAMRSTTWQDVAFAAVIVSGLVAGVWIICKYPIDSNEEES
jgi:hypothetical protein